MRQMGIKTHYIRPYTQTTIDFDFCESLKNILDEKFNPEDPNTVWVSDITYIWTFDEFVYLTSIMDLFSRKIISWVLSRTLEADYVVEAVGKAKQTRALEKTVVIHSDRSVQYISNQFLEATKEMENSLDIE